MNSDIASQFDGVTWVWFDLDDTLIDFHANSRRALRLLFDGPERIDRFYPTPDAWINAYMTHNQRLWDRYSRGEITQEFLRMDRFATPLSAGWRWSRGELEKFCRHLDRVYLDHLAEGRVMIDGAMELVEATRRRGLNTGILSNGFTDVQHRKIARNGLVPLIDRVVLSDDIGVNKPDRRLYDHAMSVAGEHDPARHLMIGDNPSTDIAGALGAGWKAILFAPQGAPEPHADSPVTARSLREITAAIEPAAPPEAPQKPLLRD